MVLASSRGISPVPRYSGDSRNSLPVRLQDYHLLWCSFPVCFNLSAEFRNASPYPNAAETALVWAVPRSLAATWGIPELVSFPPVTEMFQFSGLASLCLCIQHRMTGHTASRVSPFGHLRIKACVRLPVDFRSLSRPSSPAHAKAFTMRPSLLKKPYDLAHTASLNHVLLREPAEPQENLEMRSALSSLLSVVFDSAAPRSSVDSHVKM